MLRSLKLRRARIFIFKKGRLYSNFWRELPKRGCVEQVCKNNFYFNRRPYLTWLCQNIPRRLDHIVEFLTVWMDIIHDLRFNNVPLVVLRSNLDHLGLHACVFLYSHTALLHHPLSHDFRRSAGV